MGCSDCAMYDGGSTGMTSLLRLHRLPYMVRRLHAARHTPCSRRARRSDIRPDSGACTRRGQQGGVGAALHLCIVTRQYVHKITQTEGNDGAMCRDKKARLYAAWPLFLKHAHYAPRRCRGSPHPTPSPRRLSDKRSIGCFRCLLLRAHHMPLIIAAFVNLTAQLQAL